MKSYDMYNFFMQRFRDLVVVLASFEDGQCLKLDGNAICDCIKYVGFWHCSVQMDL